MENENKKKANGKQKKKYLDFTTTLKFMKFLSVPMRNNYVFIVLGPF